MAILYYLMILLSGTVSAQVKVTPKPDCHPIYERPCDDGHCVSILVWCDTELNCPDGSDELYCSEVVPADQPRSEIKQLPINRAAEYFIKEKDADNGWGSFTPRAIVAMSFASRVSPIAGKELMKKHLNIRLLLDLMQKQNRLSLSTLALYINALHATCQDPHNFQGIDLVERLRSDTDAAIKSNSSIPLAFLTLCIAGQIKESDGFVLARMYSMGEFQRTSSRALIVMAMICYAKNGMHSFKVHVRDFLFDRRPVIADVYSKALFMQALIANGSPLPIEELTKEQLPDGSFGDMLATYYAIPVLINSNLLELKCNGTADTGMETALKGSGEKRVIYSLWISTNIQDVKSHSLTITFDGNKTFFEIMLIAAARDPLYRFQYDEVDEQKRVYSIAGIPNDAESGKSWMLYRGKINKVMVNSDRNLDLLPIDISNTTASNEDHFVFWFTRDQKS